MVIEALRYYKGTLILIFFSTLFINTTAQNSIRGRIIYDKDAKPAAAVSVTFANHKGGNVSDQSGNFELVVSPNSNNDTIIISSVGYQSIKMPVRQALNKKEFKLLETSKELPTVVVRSFDKEQVIGDTKEKAGYFRSWNTRKGGEIGRIFPVYHNEYKVNKVRFKVNNGCNACMVRLRMRKVANGYPAEELLTDSITVSLKSLTMDSKTPEFDLTKYNIILKEKEIFVGLEVLSCENSVTTKDCSFSFVGTEKGSYLYRSKITDSWGDTDKDDFTIHLKVYLGY